MKARCFSFAAVAFLFLASAAGFAQTAPMTPDIPPQFTAPRNDFDYTKKVVMIPMRDG